jgi:hypothetical protein
VGVHICYKTGFFFFFFFFGLNLWFVGLGVEFSWNFFCHEISIVIEWFLILL